MIPHLLSVPAFMLVSFAVQGLSHFVLNADHFAAVSFMRPEPVIPLGLLVMALQGTIMTAALGAWRGDTPRVTDGLLVSLAFGGFLVSYIALVEPSKYTVPSIAGWIRVEAVAGLVQFTVFGILLGWIHTRFRRSADAT